MNADVLRQLIFDIAKEIYGEDKAEEELKKFQNEKLSMKNEDHKNITKYLN